MAEGTSSGGRTRRSVLDLLLALGGLGWLASVAYPVISYLRPLPLQGPTGPVGLTRAEVSKVERDKFAIIPVGSKRVLVLEDAGGELHAQVIHECDISYVQFQKHNAALSKPGNPSAAQLYVPASSSSTSGATIGNFPCPICLDVTCPAVLRCAVIWF